METNQIGNGEALSSTQGEVGENNELSSEVTNMKDITNSNSDFPKEDNVNIKQNEQRDTEIVMETSTITADGVQENVMLQNNMKVVMIDVNNIGIDYHPRMNSGDMKSLEASIRQVGLQEPPSVRKVGEKYVIID